MPVNFLLYNPLLRMGAYYGDSFKVECPTGSGRLMNLIQVAHELATRLIATFERDSQGRRPVFGGTEKFQTDPLWRDNLLFYEYFHGDSGAGVGASHQTGWTGCIARIIQIDGLVANADWTGGKNPESGERCSTARASRLATKGLKSSYPLSRRLIFFSIMTAFPAAASMSLSERMIPCWKCPSVSSDSCLARRLALLWGCII